MPGARSVTVTDRPVALPLLHDNVARNHVQNVVTVRELTWAQNLDQFPLAYDLLLGADIVYVEETFEDLLTTIDRLSDQRTVVLLACQIRYERDSRFVDLLRERFTVQLLHRSRDVKIFSASKS